MSNYMIGCKFCGFADHPAPVVTMFAINISQVPRKISDLGCPRCDGALEIIERLPIGWVAPMNPSGEPVLGNEIDEMNADLTC